MAAIKEVEITTMAKYEAYVFVWKIHDFVAAQETEARIIQQKFEMQVGRAKDVQSKWLVGPRGSSSNTVQFYFRLLKKTNDELKLTTRVTVQCGNTANSQKQLTTVENATAPNEEFELHTNWSIGEPEFYWRLLVDENGTCVFRLKVELLTVQTEHSENPELYLQELENESLKQLHCNFSKLLEDTSTHDIKIICSDGVEIGAHKLILSAKNTVFASMFNSDLSENRTGVIDVKDVSGKTMRVILHYLYSGKLLPEWRQPDIIVEFTYAAGKYQLTEVLTMLDGVLGSEEDSTCNLLFLNLVNKLSLKNAEAKLMERIVKLATAAKSSNDLFTIFGTGS